MAFKFVLSGLDATAYRLPRGRHPAFSDTLYKAQIERGGVKKE